MKQEWAQLGFVAAVVAFALWWTMGSSPQNGTAELLKLKADVTFLASDSLEGRGTGSEGEWLAAQFVAAEFEALGLEPKGTDGYYQPFDYRPKANLAIHGHGDTASLGMSTVQTIETRNVIGFLDHQAEHTIIIGAHHDHLGWGDENSLFVGEPAIHNGADDNASGVAALLALAKRIKNHGSHSYNYLFMTFSGEEKGLWGSKHFAQNPTLPLENINCMLNMDMVGHLNENRALAVYGNGTSPFFTPMLESIASDSLSLTFHESGIGPSDHTSFYLEDLPVLHFFTGQHEHYHKPSDDVEFMNFEGMQSVVNFIDSVTVRLEAEAKLEFTKTKDEDNESTPDFKVTLGVMPDYMHQEAGMRIDGVNEGRPASNAGLQRGDVVVKMGEFEVKDMMGYMECLGKFEAGQTTPVTVIRDGEEMTVDVTWD